eukprot:696969-Prymnesium_polylepis.1
MSVLLSFGAVAFSPASHSTGMTIPLVSFASGAPASITHLWQARNDPVMGGQVLRPECHTLALALLRVAQVR